jgi:hypothetical protein
MPYLEFSVDLVAANVKLEPAIAQRGQRINGITITDIPTGASVRVVLGGNPPTSPISAIGAFVGLENAPLSDTTLGAWIMTDAPAPGSIVRGFVSYDPDGGFADTPDTRNANGVGVRF